MGGLGVISRRMFLAMSGAGLASLGAGKSGKEEEPYPKHYGWTVEDEDYADPVTGVQVRVMTPGEGEWEVIYQTHPMWVRNMEYLIVQSVEENGRVPYARQMASGLVRPMAEAPVGAMALAPKSAKLYYVDGRRLVYQIVDSAFQKLRAPTPAGELPLNVTSVTGGISVDAEEERIFVGATLEGDSKWAVLLYDLKTRRWDTLAEVDFKVGHIQAHPLHTGVVMFCHETGGDAPQRMWWIPKPGVIHREMYREFNDQWVTHEAWWGDSRAIFTVWPYDEEHERQYHGIMSCNFQGGDVRVHSMYRAWHTHGSPDGRWILGDDFDRNLWLIKASTGQRKLLSAGHNGENFGTHPHASFTPDSRAIVMSSSAKGKQDVVAIALPEWEKLRERG